MNTQRQYPTNVTQAQWQLLLPLLPKRKWRKGNRGRPPCQFAPSVQWHPVSDEDRLPMAHAAPYLRLLADRVWLFQ